MRPQAAAGPAPWSASTGSTQVVGGMHWSAARLVIIAGSLYVVGAVWAAPPVAGRAAWKVVIPIDDRQQPVGDYVFLEPDLYDALVQRDRRSAMDQEWLLAAAEYRLAGLPQGEGASRSIDPLLVRIDLETFTPAAVVPLALCREQVHLVEGRADLDGKPVQLDWSADGRQLQFQVATPGRHRLELRSDARLARALMACDSIWRFRPSLPAASSCRLRQRKDCVSIRPWALNFPVRRRTSASGNWGRLAG